MDEKDIEFYALVVIYNRDLHDSETIKSLLTASKTYKYLINLIVWDNSVISGIDSFNSIKDSFKSSSFYHTPENLGMSVIFNRVIQKYFSPENGTNKFLILLDQDSEFDQRYFNLLIQNIQINPDINLFLPLIESNGKIVSPGRLIFFKGSLWKKPKYGVMQARNITAINSGMVISGKYLVRFKGYDERLMFYGTDSYFMIQYANDNKLLFVLNYFFKHNLSRFNQENQQIHDFRFNDIIRSLRIIFGNNNVNLFLVNLYILFLKLKNYYTK